MRSRRSRKEQIAQLVIIFLVMGLAVYSVPWPGSAVFFVAIVGGIALAVFLHRSRRVPDTTRGGRGHSRED
jgi:Flp pilus assembly protein TadB